jgi:hypothetical protein
MEVIDIGLNDLEPITFSFQDSGSSDPKPSVNFGPGIELLMNDKVKTGSASTSVDLGDLDKLENELNDLSQSSNAKSSSDTRTLGGFAANLFNFGGSSKAAPAVSETSGEPNDSNLGHATMESIGSSKTWDGFGKMGDVPQGGAGSGPRMTDRERRRKKRAMIKKLEEWYEKGQIKHSSHFTMDSSYEEIEDEYETVMDDKRKKDSVKLQGWWFMTFVNSIEYANAAFDPFGLNLDGWGEQISEDIESYEEIFSELHEKYKGGKLSPEISLLLRLGFSAAVINITNKALSTATPGFNDIMRQSPELMKMFTNATVQSMNQSSPGFGFVNSVLHPEEQVKTSFGAPPPPLDPKSQPAPPRPGMQYTPAAGNRPDISMGRGTMFREGGVDMSAPYENVQTQDRSMRQQPPPMPSNENVQGPRPEMRGPQNMDLNGLLSGLKTREVNIHEQQPQNTPFTGQSALRDNDSMVSIASLQDSQNMAMPKRTNRRKQKSDRNTISLDI